MSILRLRVKAVLRRADQGKIATFGKKARFEVLPHEGEKFFMPEVTSLPFVVKEVFYKTLKNESDLFIPVVITIECLIPVYVTDDQIGTIKKRFAETGWGHDDENVISS